MSQDLLLVRQPTWAREEVLEELWTAQEAGVSLTISALAQRIHAGPSEGWGGVVQELLEEGLVRLAGETLYLTEEGLTQARTVVRNHRLAEVLFFEVLQLPLRQSESEACRLEHLLSPEAAEAVCTFLGHPPVCPHGRPIPPGRCCQALSRPQAPLLVPLAHLKPGQQGKVVLLAPRHRDRLEQLADLGLTPGAVVHLRQKNPSVVVEVDRTLLAVEDEIAAGVYVRPLTEW
ncbi:MAG: metal-dependent transcriptional regulator [Thermoanaerobaculum sp.]|nr:metal-dependent transcriptional regulator [Thermoanaerobaculum sp.]MDW7967670.1 metal-dependent transcriptional regulator [Thermoanaerobaculum sp.]